MHFPPIFVFLAIFCQKNFEIFRILKTVLRKDKDFLKKYAPMVRADEFSELSGCVFELFIG